MGQRQEFEEMIDESSGNGGRSAGSADSAAVRVLFSLNWGHCIDPDALGCRKPPSTSTWRRLSAILNVSESAADVRVENPNFYDFKYIDSRMAILYHGEQLVVGELGTGTIRPRNTAHLPSAIAVELVRLLLNAQQDIATNVATLNINSVLSGRLSIWPTFSRSMSAPS